MESEEVGHLERKENRRERELFTQWLWSLGLDFYPRSGFVPRFDPEGPNPNPDSKMLDPSKPDPDILIF